MQHHIDIPFPTRLHDEAYALAKFVTQNVDAKEGPIVWAELAARMHAITQLAQNEAEPTCLVMCLIRELVLNTVTPADHARVDDWMERHLRMAKTVGDTLQSIS